MSDSFMNFHHRSNARFYTRIMRIILVSQKTTSVSEIPSPARTKKRPKSRRKSVQITVIDPNERTCPHHEEFEIHMKLVIVTWNNIFRSNYEQRKNQTLRERGGERERERERGRERGRRATYEKPTENHLRLTDRKIDTFLIIKTSRSTD